MLSTSTFAATGLLSWLGIGAAAADSDTSHGDTIERHLTIADRMGFERVAQIPFEIPPFGSKIAQSETLHILVHPPTGCILAVESSSSIWPDGTPAVQTSRLYFVVGMSRGVPQGASGSVVGLGPDPHYLAERISLATITDDGVLMNPQDYAFVGELDVREGLETKLNQVRWRPLRGRPLRGAFPPSSAASHRRALPMPGRARACSRL